MGAHRPSGHAQKT